MRVSNYFLPTLKENPSSAEITSHRLMIRAGMIRQQNSGIYIWLPLGIKILQKISTIVRNIMNEVGAIEILMPCIQPASLWQESGRYEDYGEEMLRITDRHDNALLFGPTNEEIITDIFRNNIKSYKELPKTLYQIQWKFRDEIRPRFGVMRGREFYMKDAYSFDTNKENAEKTYDKMFGAYIRILKRLGFNPIPVKADPGPIGGDLSHEFHVIADTGESEIFYDSEIEKEISKDNPDVAKLKNLYAMADDMHIEKDCPVDAKSLKKHRSIEVGHIFYFGIKYAKPMKASFVDETGKPSHPHCGSYGIGISRLVAAIIEASHDDKGIIWPKSVAPFDVSLINLYVKDELSTSVCEELYKDLNSSGIDTLYDDVKSGAGYKFATHDLIGIPIQIIVGSKLAEQNKVEIRNRSTGESREVEADSVLSIIKDEYNK